MSSIIQIETATTSCSAALAVDGKVIALKEANARNIHAEVLTLFIDGLLKEAGLSYADIDAFAVSRGPGSYTGLRIGVSTAKGLCFATDKPLIAVDTLAAMSVGALNRYQPAPEVLLCPMIDARRMEVYTAVFDNHGNVFKPTAAEIIDEHSFTDLLQSNEILFFGDGAEKCKTALGQHPNAKFATEFANSAADMTIIAAQKFKAKQFEDVAYFEPYYLKDFIAGKKVNV